MPNTIDQHWQEVDGDVLPPNIEPEVSAQQQYINDWELRQDHAEIAHKVDSGQTTPAPETEAASTDIDRSWRLTPETKAVGRAGVGMARAAIRAARQQ